MGKVCEKSGTGLFPSSPYFLNFYFFCLKKAIGSFKVTINWSIIVFIICFLIFLMVNNNGMINGQYSIKDHQGLLLR